MLSDQPSPGAAPLLQAINDHILIERAKGVLMHRLEIDSDHALSVLERWAMESGVKVDAVADLLVNVVCTPDQPRARELALLEVLQQNLRHERRPD
jgi:hypothetical protein